MIMAVALPDDFLKELEHIKGYNKKTFLDAHLLPSPTSVRMNPNKAIHLFTTNKPVLWCENAYYLNERPVFTLDPNYHAGAYYVQEASSMFLQHIFKTIIKDKTGLRVLDLCAAPGGKSTLIASLLDAESLLISNDVIRTRATILDENVTRWGQMNTWVTSNDPRDFSTLTDYFDVILVDAPCSGSGLFRKDPNAIKEWSLENVQLCSDRQKRILNDILPCLKNEGVLIYATCSYSAKENEDILDFVADNYNITTVETEINENWGITQVKSTKNEISGYRFFPDKLEGEGFFIAAIQKNESDNQQKNHRYKTAHNKKAYEQSNYLLNIDNYLVIPTDNENFSAIHSQHELDWHILKNILYLRKTGIRLGNSTIKDWIPAHDVALSNSINLNVPYINVTKEQALRFLKKEDILTNESGKGWFVVKYNNLGLGWIKNLGNRTNNYLPKNWRIRMELNESDFY